MRQWPRGLSSRYHITRSSPRSRRRTSSCSLSFPSSSRHSAPCVVTIGLLTTPPFANDSTPWRRIATYKVPNLPACPPGGCICTVSCLSIFLCRSRAQSWFSQWGWVANGCGEPNMYMQPFRCKVVGDTGNAAVRPGVPPVWCEDDPSKCIVGPKQVRRS